MAAGTSIRRQGVYAGNAPTKKTLTVQASDFLIGGLIGRFERNYKVAFLTKTEEEAKTIFGNHVYPTTYGSDAVKGFYDNIVGGSASLYIKGHVGYTGTAFDGVAADRIIPDQSTKVSETFTADAGTDELTIAGTYATGDLVRVSSTTTLPAPLLASKNYFAIYVSATKIKLAVSKQNAIDDIAVDITDTGTGTHTIDKYESTLQIEAAYKTELDYGAAGDRTGNEIENGYRFITATNGAGTAADVFVVVDSVAGVKVGDAIEIKSTTDLYRKVTQIDEANKKLIFTGATGEVVPSESVVNVLGFKLRTYRKTIDGVKNEVEEELGKIWCTMEPEVTDFYVENVHSENTYIKVTDLDSTSAIQETFPLDTTATEFLENGTEGTSPTTVAHWSQDLLAFDTLPARFIGNPETSNTDIQNAGELYCKQRKEDNPIWLYNFPEDQTKSQLITLGNNIQRSDDVIAVVTANWLQIVDPFATSTLAPYRHVPNTGHIMGNWIRSIEQNGIHYVPAISQNPIFGVAGVVGYTAKDDNDRTDIAEAGVNVIQDITGTGIVLKNLYTPSTLLEFQFGNALLMRNFIKVSAVDSLSGTENEPNTFERIQNSRKSILRFMLGLWDRGSTGNVPTGETFGQSFVGDDPNAKTTFEDHIQVQADLRNNPQNKINAGERNIDVWFSASPPAGSIRIRAGILLR